MDATPISKAEATFLMRAIGENDEKFVWFRMTTKVHKNPFKMQPIIACAGTFANQWSHWLDYQLKKLKAFVKSYLHNSQALLDNLKPLCFPPNFRLFTADANAMYNNIDMDHAIQVLT